MSLALQCFLKEERKKDKNIETGIQKERTHYVISYILNQQKNNTNKLTDGQTSHGSACNLYSFVFLHVPVCASVSSCVRKGSIIKHY